MVGAFLIALWFIFLAQSALGESYGLSVSVSVPDRVVKDTRWYIAYWAGKYGYKDVKKAEAIVSCEGGFNDPRICNREFGCRAGQGHSQFIPSTWSWLQKEIGVQDVFDTSDNIQGLIYLLQKDGDRHWRPYSGACWVPKL